MGDEHPHKKALFGLTIGHKLNRLVAESRIGKYFKIDERRTSFLTELRAGTVLFLTIAYILPVNAGILSDTGATCKPYKDCTAAGFALAGDACKFFDPGYADCVTKCKQQLISATSIAAMLACILMGVIANVPFSLAPGMGINAYFTYTIVGYYGTGSITYEAGLAAVFVEGLIFMLISAVGVRGKLVQLIPKHVMMSTACGIGMFLAFIGLQASEGLGVVGLDTATIVGLGGCKPNHRSYPYVFPTTAPNFDSASTEPSFNSLCDVPDSSVINFPSVGSVYSCDNMKMRDPKMWLGIYGGILMVLLTVFKARAAILWGVLFTTFISWIPHHEATYLVPGSANKEFFLKGGTAPVVNRVAGTLDFKALGHGHTWVALVMFLYLDFMDATSTMVSMSKLVGHHVPGFLDENGSWPRQTATMMMDGFAITIGSILGTSPLTVMVESAVGIREGGRTGLTVVTTGLWFGLAMFLSPIFSSIPPYATGPALVLVGAFMMDHARYIDWEDVRVAVPSFLTIILMPLLYSIAYGVIGGIFSSLVIEFLVFIFKAMLNLYDGIPIKITFYQEFSRIICVLMGPEFLASHGISGYDVSNAGSANEDAKVAHDAVKVPVISAPAH